MRPAATHAGSAVEQGSMPGGQGTALWIVVLGWSASAILLAVLERMGMPTGGLAAVAVAVPLSVVLVVAGLGALGRGGAALGSGGTAAAAWASSGVAAGALPMVAYVGALSGSGFDALWVGFGSIAGLVLAMGGLTPFLARLRCRSVRQFLVARFGRGTAVVAGILTVMAAVLLLAALFAILGAVAARVAGLPLLLSVPLAAALVLVATLPGLLRSSPLAPAALAIIVLAGVVLVGGLLAWSRGGTPFAAIAYGSALEELARVEIGLLGQRLADSAGLKRHVAPFLTIDQLSFIASALTLAAGVATLPMLLERPLASPTPRGARAAAAMGLLAFLPLMLLAPGIAVFVKLAVLKQLVGAVPVAAIPDWMRALGAGGDLRLCGVPANDVTAVAAACKALGGHKGVVRLQDFALEPDAVWLAVSSLTGVSAVASALAASATVAAALAAALAAAQNLATAVAVEARSAAATAAILGGVLAAAVAAILWPGDAVSLALWPFIILAGGLFPVMVLGVWSRRVNGPGAVAGALAGASVTIYYLWGTRYGALGFAEFWAGVSNASLSSLRKLAVLRDAWERAVPGQSKDAAYAALLAHARATANWWGLKPTAAGVIGAGVAIPVAVVVSLLTRRPHPQARAVIAALRGETDTSMPS